MSIEKKVQTPPADPCSFVIFGALGDLTRRLLMPALYNLAAQGLLSEQFSIVAVGREQMSPDAFRNDMRAALAQFGTQKVDRQVADRLLACIQFVYGDLNDDKTYGDLKRALEAIEGVRGTGGNRLFYCATPPTMFAPIAEHLAAAGLTQEENGAWRRVIVEKPFGTDLASAQALNRKLLAVLKEDQIFRMDHYLGKETVQNILILRFANGLFEPVWNRNHIDHVQITVAETVDVGLRGQFYDATGALRDMVPNHLFQLLSLVAMEPPSRFEANGVRSEKAEALDSIRINTPEEALAHSVRGQYVAGEIGDRQVGAYRDAQHVGAESTTETFAAMRLDIDNWRWAGVPFYLRTGKAMGIRRTEIVVKFKQAPVSMFRNLPMEELAENLLVIRIAPEEGMKLHFNAKIPGPEVEIAPVGMTFRYKDYFEAVPATGYETLIYDCMTGDSILYQRADGVEAGWRAVEPFLQAWKNAGTNGLETYAAGSDGPKAAHDLLARDGRKWRELI
ncbi:glucose-6-phosphate dehydrogenase [Terrihabitans rhizophilus]|uniref:Glucose-6-phosphate 1-dehydrogenase n=1 Tax=Terrihabitans rhizophilus TaxID=3092662 RepID=A0ABU4RLF2_9HYPH|nr:glucose-6-phosphate dehydrogenase [Terrihabitans sp. PJ23]MDX6805657.1 glucose-6-phosphate dehydrogenase [Terrihabitans sp. PJ23]